MKFSTHITTATDATKAVSTHRTKGSNNNKLANIFPIALLRKKIRFMVLSAMLILTGATTAYADCTITSIDASQFATLYPTCTGRLVIPNGVTLSIDGVFVLPAGIDSIIVEDGGHIFFNNGPSKVIELSANQSIIIYDRVTTGSNAALNGACNNNDGIRIGGLTYAACVGGGGNTCLTFAEVIAQGGTIRANPIISVNNSITGRGSVCFDKFSFTVNLSGYVYRPQDQSYPTYMWSQVSGPGTSTFSPAQVINNTDSNVLVSVTMPGTYVFRVTVTNPLSSNCANQFVSVFSDITVIVNPGSSAVNLDSNTVTLNAGFNPIYNNTTQCRLITTIRTTLTGNDISGIVTAKVWVDAIQQSHNGQPYGIRHYEIAPGAPTNGANACITFYFLQSEFDSFNAVPYNGRSLPTEPGDSVGISNLRIIRYNGRSSDGSGTPGSYTGLGSIINPNNADIFYNNATMLWEVTFCTNAFGGFFLSNDNPTILPITLKQFNATLQNGKNALLTWHIAQPEEGIRYDLQRSTDGTNFTTVNVQTGNTSTVQYTYSDAGLNDGKYYYRLKIANKQNIIVYSSIAIVQVGFGKAQLVVYPNPIRSASVKQLNISVSNSVLQGYKLTDALGKVLLVKEGLSINGSINISLPQQLETGFYFLQLKTDKGTSTQKIVVE